jgi:hypothetical protein
MCQKICVKKNVFCSQKLIIRGFLTEIACYNVIQGCYRSRTLVREIYLNKTRMENINGSLKHSPANYVVVRWVKYRRSTEDESRKYSFRKFDPRNW